TVRPHVGPPTAGRLASPELIDEAFDRGGAARIECEEGKQGALAVAAEWHGHTRSRDLNDAQESDLDRTGLGGHSGIGTAWPDPGARSVSSFATRGRHMRRCNR